MAQADASHKNVFKFWGKVETKEEAIELTKSGTAAAYVCAAVTAALAVAAIFGFSIMAGLDAWALADATVFAALGWGISRYSRIAAILALVLYIVERAMAFSQTPSHLAIIAVMFIIFFVNGVRGTVAYHRLRTASDGNGPADV